MSIRMCVDIAVLATFCLACSGGSGTEESNGETGGMVYRSIPMSTDNGSVEVPDSSNRTPSPDMGVDNLMGGQPPMAGLGPEGGMVIPIGGVEFALRTPLYSFPESCLLSRRRPALTPPRPAWPPQ